MRLCDCEESRRLGPAAQLQINFIKLPLERAWIDDHGKFRDTPYYHIFFTCVHCNQVLTPVRYEIFS